jgi:hypothetical protein
LEKIKRNNKCLSHHSVRLFSTKSFKSLGTLVHHKAGIQALAFAHARLLVAPAASEQHCRHHHTRHRHYHHHQQEQQEYGGRQCDANATDGGEAAVEADSTEEDKADIDEGRGGPRTYACGDGDEIDEDDEMTTGEKARHARWLVSGGKDGRVVIWELMDFDRARSGGFGRTEAAKE